MSRIAIIGAGPIGLEAALLATQLGHDVQVFEKGRVAENILDWGHVRLFSPFGMNSSEWSRGALAQTHGPDALPHDDELLTGRGFAERYLIPLSQLPELAGRIHEQTKVNAISRQHFPKTTGIGSAERGKQPFQLLVENSSKEAVEFAEVVLDCSGTYPHHNWIGEAGMPCIGERRWLSDRHYRLPEIVETKFANRVTAVIGSGYSAASTVVSLAAVAKSHPRTKILWLAKASKSVDTVAYPLVRVVNDPLIERDQLAKHANALAMLSTSLDAVFSNSHQSSVAWLADVAIRSLKPFQSCREVEDNGFILEIEQPMQDSISNEQPHESRRVIVDYLIANVGYRPDRSIYEELHVHECYATQGPIKLAAKLLGETSSDCLAQTTHGADVLKNPEPNFFILGSKSYGRNSNFLLKVGIEQVREVLASLNSVKGTP